MLTRREYLLTVPAGGTLTLAGCAELDSVGTNDPEIPSEAYPPGTDERGIIDSETLFESHLNELRNRSYTYEHRYAPMVTDVTQMVKGRQQDGMGGPRLVQERYERDISQEDPAFELYRERNIRAWHGADMPTETEYRKVTVTTEVSDPEYYNETFGGTEEYPPGTHVSYERYGFNSLEQNQKGLLPGTFLRRIAYVPDSFDSNDGTVRFVADGFTNKDSTTRGVSVSGHISIDTDGIIREISTEIDELLSDRRGVGTVKVTGLGSTHVGTAPEWVSSAFQ